MTMTRQQSKDFGGPDVAEDRRPGTLDVGWAEEAMRHSLRTGPSESVRQPRQHRRPLRGFRRVLAAMAITICLVVGILIAPDETSPALHGTSTPVSATSDSPSVPPFSAETPGATGAPTCSTSESTRQEAMEGLGLLPTVPCLGLPLLEQQTAAQLARG